MQRIKMTVPAPVSNFGPGLGGMAMALQLNSSVTFSPREDSKLHVEVSGMDADAFDSLDHPTVLAASRVFQHLEQAPQGVTIRVNNNIPLGRGLSADAAFAVAGVLGAVNLMDVQLPRAAMLRIAALTCNDPAGAAAVMLGGLATAILHGDDVYFRQVAPVQTRVVLVVPEIKRYRQRTPPKNVRYDDAQHNMERLPLLIEALREMDYALLSALMDDRVHAPNVAKNITAYDKVVAAAKSVGAVAAGICGDGPAMFAFVEDDPHAVADAMRGAFAAEDIAAQTWVLPVDRQGVVVSMTQSAR
ncbi:MAG: hypothetical protein AAFV33_01100 [Chloroflexota bacterium]